jgi:hypothetical protein
MIVRAAVNLVPRTLQVRHLQRRLALPYWHLQRPAVKYDLSLATHRFFASSRSADEVMEDLQEM